MNAVSTNNETRLRLRMVPPAWLALFAASAYVLNRLLPMPLAWQMFLAQWPLHEAAVVLWIGAGTLVAWAAGLFLRAGTTIHPHGESDALVVSGPYRFTRNPMYVAMTAALTGWALWLATPMALPLIPAFMWVLTRRHIRFEEQRLTERFGAAYRDYRSQVRRWL
ncbi:MAG: isoprenylcysteine carboxylmethyltransferase family protein [Chromatiales bacterium]|nr:isoprenylcysteine carboxylmethyltransferase family protein [Chromatiales bacterium]